MSQVSSLMSQVSWIVSVLHQDEGGIGKSIPDARKISRDPRDFPRAKPEGNLEGRGKSGGQRGWISQYLPSFGGARTISQHQFFYREWIRKSFPVDREGLTVLKSILPCWWWQIVKSTNAQCVHCSVLFPCSKKSPVANTGEYQITLWLTPCLAGNILLPCSCYRGIFEGKSQI